MDKQSINANLKLYKTEGGQINFPAVLSIKERLPAMVKTDPKGTTAVIVVGLTMAFESMNLSRPMNERQILDLADAILDSSSEDYLSLEDVMLFLQGLVRGKYGPLYESMDIPKFMEKFEVYRQERHEEYHRIKEEQHAQFKAMGRMDRTSDNTEREAHRTALGDHLKELYKEK